MKCQKCQTEVFLPFRCPYCGGYYCSEHRLPENHKCQQIEQARAPREETRPAIDQKQRPHTYTVTYGPLQRAKQKIRFSNKEIKHLAIASALVMGIGLSWAVFLEVYAETSGPFTLALFTVILTASFLSHEIAHKTTAQRNGLWAEFRLTLMGSILTLFSIISPLFKIISPGAVMISGLADRETIGKISIAGPLTNIVLSIVFLAPSFLLPQYNPIFSLSVAFNAWIAFFNLIPFGVLDGSKVLAWNKKVWSLAFAASLILTLISYRFIL